MPKTKMSERKLLELAQAYESDSAQYVNTTLQRKRTIALNDYNQRPYGNEQEGWSSYVSADVHDTIEGMLPDVMDPFVSSDKAVIFEPTRASEVEGAKQATAAANHVFYQQNNGFLVLYTAFKDALIETNCAVHVFKQTETVRRVEKFQGATEEQIAAMMAPQKEGAPEAEVDEDSLQRVGEVPLMDPMRPGQPMFNADGTPATQLLLSGRIVRDVQRPRVVVEAFEPENLLVARTWTSPLLEDCPYVCRAREMTLSQVNALAEQYGFPDVTPEELAGSRKPDAENMQLIRARRNGDDVGPWGMGLRNSPDGVDTSDPASTTGWVRYEWILADKDGDGHAERRFVLRLQDKVLHDDECDAVPIVTGSPVLRPHIWDGMSVAEQMSDIQLLHTELMRGVINNAYASNNPRKVVLTDKNDNPLVNVDDLLDSRFGGAIRTRDMNAIRMEPTEYVGQYMEPLLQRVDTMRESRSGFTKQRSGIDPNMLRNDRTLGETRIMDAASRQRLKLMARILGETIVAPAFKLIHMLLTSGDFDPIFMELRGEFVEYDPNEWDQGYRMRCNVGLGLGDTEQQQMELTAVYNTQKELMASPLGEMMVKPGQLYNTLAARLDLMGFKNPGLFFTDPKDAPLPKPPPQPPLPLMIEDMKQKGENLRKEMQLQWDAQKATRDAQQQRQLKLDQDSVQAANDDRDAQAAQMELAHTQEMDALKLQLDKYVADLDAAVKLTLAEINANSAAAAAGEGDSGAVAKTSETVTDLTALMSVITELRDAMSAPTEILRDAGGAIVGSRKVRPQPESTTP